ncbi:MAG: hypothetical protein C4308_08240 [Chitinophagaceae bacterium]
MPAKKLTAIEVFVLLFVALIVAIGFYLFYTNLPKFLYYTQEDHLVEWLTVLGLLAGSAVCFVRFFKLLKRRGGWFLLVTFLLGLLLFFAAGEEVSWGQRIFRLKSSEFFEKYNAQGELNFHNLVVGGVKINKLIFSIGLIVCLSLYLLVLPLLYQKNSSLKKLVNNSGVPVPESYQIIAFVLLFIIVSLLRHEKNAEILECGTAVFLFLIIAYPKNKEVFQ